MPVASAPRAATVAACGSGGAGWPRCSASKACQQNEKAQQTSVQCRRIARSLLTWKSAQSSSSQPIWSVAGQRVVVGPSPMRRDCHRRRRGPQVRQDTADRPLNQSREAHRSAWPHTPPRGPYQPGRQSDEKLRPYVSGTSKRLDPRGR
jgi:hypothetical protein